MTVQARCAALSRVQRDRTIPRPGAGARVGFDERGRGEHRVSPARSGRRDASTTDLVAAPSAAAPSKEVLRVEARPRRKRGHSPPDGVQTPHARGPAAHGSPGELLGSARERLHLVLLGSIPADRTSSPTSTRSEFDRSPMILRIGDGQPPDQRRDRQDLVAPARAGGSCTRSITSIWYWPARCSSQSFFRLANAATDFGVCPATYSRRS